MAHTALYVWQQVWPNLAGNVLWVPVVVAHHWLLRRHLTRKLREHHNRLEGR